MAKTPLADRIRPMTLDDVVGQHHLTAPAVWERLLLQILLLKKRVKH